MWSGAGHSGLCRGSTNRSNHPDGRRVTWRDEHRHCFANANRLTERTCIRSRICRCLSNRHRFTESNSRGVCDRRKGKSKCNSGLTTS
jgi:hypothetical protein